MDENIEFIDTFDGDKLLSEYKTMSLEEIIKFLGDEQATILNERINNGTLNLQELLQICKDAYPNYPQRAQWLYSIIMSKLPGEGKYEYLRGEGIDEELIGCVVKMDDYKEKIQKGTITQSELKELCDITFGKESEESSIIFDRMSRLVKSDEIQEYDRYRKQLNTEYLKEKDSNTFLTSSFTMLDVEQRKCKHSLLETKNQETKIIMSKTFAFNELFQKNMLEPAIVDFAERNPIMSSDIRQNTESQNTSNYRAISENNNILKVNNINSNYASIVASVVSYASSTIYKQQTISHQHKSTTGMTMGFINNLLIFSLIGIIIGVLFVIFLYLF